MTQEFYALQKFSDGRRRFISKFDMNSLTDNPKEALSFFSKNHVEVWKKCNPSFKNVFTVKMIKNGDIVTIKEE